MNDPFIGIAGSLMVLAGIWALIDAIRSQRRLNSEINAVLLDADDSFGPVNSQ